MCFLRQETFILLFEPTISSCTILKPKFPRRFFLVPTIQKRPTARGWGYVTTVSKQHLDIFKTRHHGYANGTIHFHRWMEPKTTRSLSEVRERRTAKTLSSGAMAGILGCWKSSTATTSSRWIKRAPPLLFKQRCSRVDLPPHRVDLRSGHLLTIFSQSKDVPLRFV